jgi:AcrR family transcriptional regulator
MQAVADALGVSDAALYHHFRNREALVSAVVDATVRTAPFPEDRGQDWRAWMSEFAGVLRAVLVEHPGSAAFAAGSGPTSPEQMRLVARAIGVLARAGFEEREAKSDAPWPGRSSATSPRASRRRSGTWRRRTGGPSRRSPRCGRARRPTSAFASACGPS